VALQSESELKKLGPDYQAVIIGAVGRSNGEDALLGPAEWKSNPQSMKGKTVVGVIRDGDWNIALNYMGSNGLKNNPDLKTYDPDAVNWICGPGRGLHQSCHRGICSQSLRRPQGGQGWARNRRDQERLPGWRCHLDTRR
jgi:hypothetical protein